ncbi:hypothetical protein CA54_31750 [Symmachiella macrocystis]|uniref:Uncharacterized protein n=1 Tax=Symmachiella macrocystis TaxID=2527985 RepID=A0A5C6BQ25_9PLAN|nr:hypothetical protein CA54_31750 [Symmachiella macrocystis]
MRPTNQKSKLQVIVGCKSWCNRAGQGLGLCKQHICHELSHALRRTGSAAMRLCMQSVCFRKGKIDDLSHDCLQWFNSLLLNRFMYLRKFIGILPY